MRVYLDRRRPANRYTLAAFLLCGFGLRGVLESPTPLLVGIALVALVSAGTRWWSLPKQSSREVLVTFNDGTQVARIVHDGSAPHACIAAGDPIASDRMGP